jgi:hypothetical protein
VVMVVVVRQLLLVHTRRGLVGGWVVAQRGVVGCGAWGG